jgi:Oxidoreductase family, NAD-binding Rossmann fold
MAAPSGLGNFPFGEEFRTRRKLTTPGEGAKFLNNVLVKSSVVGHGRNISQKCGFDKWLSQCDWLSHFFEMSSSIHSLRAGIIGSGFIAPVHIEALRRIGVQVTAICGSERARAVAAQWDIPGVFTGHDFQNLVTSPEVDVVHITSPNRHHHVQSLAAQAAGKHV